MIIMMMGSAGSGKTTVGDILKKRYHFKTMSFASAVKDVTSTIFGWERHLLEGDTSASRAFREEVDEVWSYRFGSEVTPRLMLQKVATEAIRDNIHQDIWAYSVVEKLRKARGDTFDRGKDFVITDSRFPNEINIIRKHFKDVVTIRVNTPTKFDWEPDAVAYLAEQKKWNSLPPEVRGPEPVIPSHLPHVSEWLWMGTEFDFTIENDLVNMDTLIASVDDIVKNQLKLRVNHDF
jgi:hypothetical protein